MYLIVSLLVLLSFLSLSLFSALYWWVFASASETNRSSLTEFLLQQGQGRVYTEGRDGGIVNCRKIKEQRSQRPYNTAAKAEKYWVGALILKGEVSKIHNG